MLETRNIVGNEVFPDGKVEQWDVSEDRIELPRGALVENSEAGLVRIVFVAFDRLETILKPWLNHLDVKFTKGESKFEDLLFILFFCISGPIDGLRRNKD